MEPAKLKLLAFTSERLTFEPGQELFHQGDLGDAIYIMLDGDGGRHRRTRRRGRSRWPSWGRTTSSARSASSATCRAPPPSWRQPLATLRITKDLFFQVIAEFPTMAIEIMRELAHRLEHTTTSCARPAPACASIERAAACPHLAPREPARQLHPPAAGAARLPRPRRGLVARLPGPVLEVGLGNGRTYDHLRELLPGPRHLRLRPPGRGPSRLHPAGRPSVPGRRRWKRCRASAPARRAAALIHADIGTGDSRPQRRWPPRSAPARRGCGAGRVRCLRPAAGRAGPPRAAAPARRRRPGAVLPLSGYGVAPPPPSASRTTTITMPAASRYQAKGLKSWRVTKPTKRAHDDERGDEGDDEADGDLSGAVRNPARRGSSTARRRTRRTSSGWPGRTRTPSLPCGPRASSIAPRMVAPERDTSGIIASTWQKPILSARSGVKSSRPCATAVRGFHRSIANMHRPPTITATATTQGENRYARDEVLQQRPDDGGGQEPDQHIGEEAAVHADRSAGPGDGAEQTLAIEPAPRRGSRRAG